MGEILFHLAMENVTYLGGDDKHVIENIEGRMPGTLFKLFGLVNV